MDSIMGSVRNPWGYPYDRLGETASHGGPQVAFWNEVDGAVAHGTSSGAHSPATSARAATPLDWHIAGGSSGGSAAAVAAGISLA